MFEAARFGDQIAHSGAMGGFVLGAVLGIGLVAAVAVTTFTCGFGAALLAGLAAGIGGSLITSLGETIGSGFLSPSGTLITASPNVFINGRKAAHVDQSIGACEKHPGPIKVAEGSTNVFINGLPAARKGDKLACGAVVNTGSGNVFIGGGQYRYLPVIDEVPTWLRDTVGTLMAIAGAAGGIVNVLKMGAQAGMKAALPCALKFTAGFVTGEVASRYVAEPVIRRVVGGLIGHPVDTTTGRKLIPDEVDFSLPGFMPLAWTRFYASNLDVNSVLGKGWLLPWEQSLRRYGDFVYLTDNQGRTVPFMDIAPGQRIYNPHEQLYLVRTQGGHYLLQTLDNLFFYFGEVPANNTRVPLDRIENALGHFLHFTRTPDGTLTDICTTGGLRVHLHYDEVNGRLSAVKRIVDNQAVETLVRYRYDSQGQLAGVINRNGDSVRQFSYTDGLMTRQGNALGLACEYRWETLGGQPRVVEHRTSDGEHFQFRYDLDGRTTWVTDVLGHELQVQYNRDHRVIASRDYNGDRYAIDLDDSGNMTGLALPDGNRLTFVYDEFARLVSETDPLGRSTRYRYHHLTTLVTQVDYPDDSTVKAHYDAMGNLLDETDALGQMTEYLNGDDGLPHTIIDPTLKRKYLWWNTLAQVERFQDCSGKRTCYRYDDRHHLVTVTDALGQTTTLERKPEGEVLSLQHPDGTQESFTYNALGQVLTHTDGKGQTTRLQRNSRGLPTLRRDASGHTVSYAYDKVQRLIGLSNENNATYRFAYDAADRLVEEQRIDQLTRRFAYNAGGHLTQVEEIGFGERGERPERVTTFERDTIGRLLAKVNEDGRQTYDYDQSDRLLSIERHVTSTGKKRGITPEKLTFAYDILGRLVSETTGQGTVAYEYDPLDNLTTLVLPTGQHLNHLYYGSGHLHQLNLDGQVITDLERDDLHREIHRTQGRLTSCFGYDARGRKAWQYATTLPSEKLSKIHTPAVQPFLYVEHAYNPIHRRYHYDPAGELSRTVDKLRGETHYTYEPNGRLHSSGTGRLVGTEEFRYDPAANRLNFNTRKFDRVRDNRISTWRNQTYTYDPWGNLVEKTDNRGWLQKLAYDGENRLVEVQTYAQGRLDSVGTYRYDSLGRRVAKGVEIDGHTEHKHFLWQGLRLLREEEPGHSRLYLYEPDSYAPLARVDATEGDTENRLYYFHTDQIGTPLEMTDADGRIVWQARYWAWGAINTFVVNEVEQNLRFQGQYFDDETGLHYNTFRYYDPEVGRFTTQDPIGLLGGENLYQYAPSPVGWVDPLGLSSRVLRSELGMKPNDMHAAHHIIPEEVMKKYPAMFNRAKTFGFNPDGPSNGIELPRVKALAEAVGLPGHWSSHIEYSALVESDVAKLNSAFRSGRISDMDLALGIKSIQNRWRSNINSGKVPINKSGRLC